MKAKITRLNALYASGGIDCIEYKTRAMRLLAPMDWQKRIQYENMLFTSV